MHRILFFLLLISFSLNAVDNESWDPVSLNGGLKNPNAVKIMPTGSQYHYFCHLSMTPKESDYTDEEQELRLKCGNRIPLSFGTGTLTNYGVLTAAHVVIGVVLDKNKKPKKRPMLPFQIMAGVTCDTAENPTHNYLWKKEDFSLDDVIFYEDYLNTTCNTDTYDLALIKLPRSSGHVKRLPIIDSPLSGKRTPIEMFHHPGGRLEQYYEAGLADFQSFCKPDSRLTLHHHDLHTLPGSSGGALIHVINQQRYIVGVHTKGMSDDFIPYYLRGIPFLPHLTRRFIPSFVRWRGYCYHNHFIPVDKSMIQRLMLTGVTLAKIR